MEKYKLIVILLWVLFSTCCAKMNQDSTEQASLRNFHAFMKVFYPNAQLINPDDSTKGYFIMRKTGGTTSVPNECSLSLDYNVRNVSEDPKVQKTSLEDEARLYGLFSYEWHYVSDYLFREQIRENIFNFIQQRMNVGDSVTLFLPGLEHNQSGGMRIKETNATGSAIYNIRLTDLVTDQKQREEDTLINFVNKYNSTAKESEKFLEIDTLPKFWICYQDTSKRSEKRVPVADGKKVTVDYAGYFTDGFLFDSNIKTLLKKRNPKKDTTTLKLLTEVEYFADSTKFPYVRGWHKAFGLLMEGDKVEVVFSSEYGYGKYGDTRASRTVEIFGHTPLRFYIHIKTVK